MESQSEPHCANDAEHVIYRGENLDRYKIYVECAQSLGWVVKSYDEWLNS